MGYRIVYTGNILIGIYFFTFVAFLSANNLSAYLATSADKVQAKLHLYSRRVFEDLTVIVPCHNEAISLIGVMTHYEHVDYPKALYMIFVDDGSTDATSQLWLRFNDAVPVPARDIPLIHDTIPLRGSVSQVWRSQKHPTWILVQKTNHGGLKADALNAGLQFTLTPYVAIVDGDTVPDVLALQRIMQRIYSSHSPVVIAGGAVRVLDGVAFDNEKVVKTAILPRNLLAKFQVLEYARYVYNGARGLDRSMTLPFTSGAFTVYRVQALLGVGGFNCRAIAEDIDVFWRIILWQREALPKARSVYAADAIAFTRVPHNLGDLQKQRTRWMLGLWQTLWLVRRSLTKLSVKQRVVVLSLLFIEAGSVVIQWFGLGLLVVAIVLGLVNWSWLLLFAFLSLAIHTTSTLIALMNMDQTLRRYPAWQSTVQLWLLSWVEPLMYMPFTIWARWVGTWLFLTRQNLSWHSPVRQEVHF